MSENSEEDSSDEPFAEILDELEEKRRDTASSVDTVSRDTSSERAGIDTEDVFTEESFDHVDTEELWDELEVEEGGDGSTAGAEYEATGGEISDDTDTHVVPKRSFCQSCRYLSEPPEFRCTHDGTEIVEFVDMETVRVRECPIVEERQEESERRP